MIYYNSGLRFLLCNVMRMSGSVFPTCFLIALPCALISAGLHLVHSSEALLQAIPESIMLEAQAWSGFTSLVGFLIVFRTSQAYSRWWEGCSATFQMRAEFLDASSSVIAFCKGSQAPTGEITKFKNTFVRLVSMLHASALAEVEEVTDGDGMPAQRYELLDPEGINIESLKLLRVADCKVELLFTWVQQCLIESMNKGILNTPPPILSRVFQEMAQGMVHYNNAMKLSSIPFPFAYAQACDCLLIVHWIIAPVITSQWVETPWWAGIVCFIQVFTLWALNTIAVGIENPFGADAMDLDGSRMQEEMNTWLRMFLIPAVENTPFLTTERAEEIVKGLDSTNETVVRPSTHLRTSRHFHTLLANQLPKNFMGDASSDHSGSEPEAFREKVEYCPSIFPTDEVLDRGRSGFYQSTEDQEPSAMPVPSHRSEGEDWRAAIRNAKNELQYLEPSDTLVLVRGKSDISVTSKRTTSNTSSPSRTTKQAEDGDVKLSPRDRTGSPTSSAPLFRPALKLREGFRSLQNQKVPEGPPLVIASESDMPPPTTPQNGGGTPSVTFRISPRELAAASSANLGDVPVASIPLVSAISEPASRNPRRGRIDRDFCASRSEGYAPPQAQEPRRGSDRPAHPTKNISEIPPRIRPPKQPSPMLTPRTGTTDFHLPVQI